MAEQERTPEEWARELGVKLHGMPEERWAAYLRYLEDENRDELAKVCKLLLEESKDLHAALHADKLVEPLNQEQRRRLSSDLGELRARRQRDIRERYEALKNEGEA